MAWRMTRRTFTASGLVAAGSFAVPAVHVRAQNEQRILRILGWPSYFNDAITAPFREANNVRIEVTGIGTPDDTMLFLRAGGVGFYDLVAPSIGLVNPLGASGLLAELDESAIPNFSGLFLPFQQLPASPEGKRYGIPLLWGTFGLVYSTADVTDPPAEWLDLRDEAYTDRLVMPDDGLGHFWIWNWALGAEDPTRVSQDWLDNTTDLLIELKQNRAAAFGGSDYDAMMQVANGTGQLSTVGWQSAPLLTNDGQKTLVAGRPAPGGASFCDCIAMVANSHDPELTQQFIDFMLSNESQRDLINSTRWATVAQGAPPLIDPNTAALYDYQNLDDWLSASPVRGYPPVTDDGSGSATYLDWVIAWDRVRQAKR
jgi:spermidine/putrescine transport system substrate-binding protein